MHQGVIAAEIAALLAELVAQRASIVVAAGPSGAGKTTVLTALLDYLPPEIRRVYIRGCYEPFEFLKATNPHQTALLVNEISGHLPIYLWGDAVRRVLAAVRDGYQLCATAHASCVEEFVHGLAGYPLRVPPEALRAVDLLVILDAWQTPSGVRRAVRSVVSLSTPCAHGEIEPAHLAIWDQDTARLRLDLAAVQQLIVRLGGDLDQILAAIGQRTAEYPTVRSA